MPEFPVAVIVLVLVPEPKTVKNRVHLDVRCDRVNNELERTIELGASIAAEYDGHVVLRDPEGNEFCLYGRA